METKKTVKKTTKKAESAALSADVYTTAGKKHGSVELPGAVFGLPWNAGLVHQVVTSMEANARTPVAHARTRGEVRGGGKKPWKQKGTGRARHGSSRSPIWIGGGVTHGPRNDKDYSKKINKKMRAKALGVVLSKKLKDSEVLFVDAFEFAAPKAKDAKTTLMQLSKVDGFSTLNRTKNAALIAVPSLTAATVKSFRNFGNIAVKEASRISPVDVLRYKHVIVVSPEESIALIAARFGGEAK